MWLGYKLIAYLFSNVFNSINKLLSINVSISNVCLAINVYFTTEIKLKSILYIFGLLMWAMNELNE